jgi:hypothetical protein
LLRYGPSEALLDQWQILETVRLVRPVGVYFDQNWQRLYVTDVATHQVHVFEVESLEPDSATENGE